jgi:hypothetical protein
MKSAHEKLTKTNSISLVEAKAYLTLCAKGKYDATPYHKKKCERILDAFGSYLYNGGKQGAYLHDTATAMIEEANRIQSRKKNKK